MKADFLKIRAEDFLRDAKYDISEERWTLAAFHLEQTAQLYFKYFLFKRLGDYPKIHPLDKLLAETGKAYGKEPQTEKFIKEHASVLGDLNQAYITSRYLPVEFNKFQVKNMLKFVGELIKFLKEL